MSEIFHRKGIATERTLAILSLRGRDLDQRSRLAESPETLAFFLPLKQDNYETLKAVTDFISTASRNGRWPERSKGGGRYWNFS